MSNVHVFLKVETMSTKSNAAIVQIGAVKFDFQSGEIQSEFLINVSLKDCISHGLDVEQSTVEYWKIQDKEDVAAMMVNGKPLKEALEAFKSWYGTESLFTWENSLNFATEVLENAFEVVGMRHPWKYYDLCDFRTIYNLSGKDKGWLEKRKLEMDVKCHNALQHCKFQSKMLMELLT